jgi:hypothetical protein
VVKGEPAFPVFGRDECVEIMYAVAAMKRARPGKVLPALVVGSVMAVADA